MQPISLEQQQLSFIKEIGRAKIWGQPYAKFVTDVRSRVELINKAIFYKGSLSIHSPEKYNRILNTHKTIIEYYVSILDRQHKLEKNKKTINTPDEIFSGFHRYVTENPAEYFSYEMGIPVKEHGTPDKVTRDMRKEQLESQGAMQKQKLKWSLKCAHESGWYIIFDTVTLQNEKLFNYCADETAVRDYTKACANMVMDAEIKDGLYEKKNKPGSNKYYQYFCAPEYGSANGRLHFHILHLVRTLPENMRQDPCKGMNPVQQKEFKTTGKEQADAQNIVTPFKDLWKYGIIQKTLAVRYDNDAYKKDGWKTPVDQVTGETKRGRVMDMVANYVTKYVTKVVNQSIEAYESDHDASAKTTELSVNMAAWRGIVKRHVPSYIDVKNPKISMSRSLGRDGVLSMGKLEHHDVITIANVSGHVTPFGKIFRKVAKEELLARFLMHDVTLSDITIPELSALSPEDTPMSLRRRIEQGDMDAQEQYLAQIQYVYLEEDDLSDEVMAYLAKNTALYTVKEKEKEKKWLTTTKMRNHAMNSQQSKDLNLIGRT